jgi:hypothetical protein
MRGAEAASFVRTRWIQLVLGIVCMVAIANCNRGNA